MNFQIGKKNLIEKWNKDYTLKSLFILCAPLFVLTLLFNNAIMGLTFFILFFTIFDIYGFKNVQKIDEFNKGEFVDTTMNYRVTQMMVQFLLYGFIFLSCGWQCVVACIIVHWFTLCDKLFYILQKIKEEGEGDYYWLDGWSVFALLKLAGNKTISTKEFNTMSLIGFLLGLAFVIFL